MATHTLNADIVVPALNPNWGIFGSGFSDVGYWKDPTGHVHLKGVLESTTGAAQGDVLFTLPPGFRPAERHVFVVWDAAATQKAARVDIDNAGKVYWQGDSGASQIPSLSGIPPFLAEA